MTGAVSHFNHALDCKKGGLVMNWNNYFYDRFSDLARKVFMTSHMRVYPLIHTGCDIQSVKAHICRKLIGIDFSIKNHPKVTDYSGEKGDLLIRYL